MKWLEELRQLTYRPEFRIREPEWRTIFDCLRADLESSNAALPKPRSTEDFADQEKKLVLAVATNLWRTRQKMIDSSGKPQVEMRKAFRHVQAIWDALLEHGVEIQDHTNQPFHLGQALNAIAFEPTTGLVKETVIETVKPTVYVHKRLIQVGDVIVGTPVGSAIDEQGNE
jgi:hypothetical protein